MKQTKVAIIIETNTALRTLKENLDLYPTGDNPTKQEIEIWKQSRKVQLEEWTNAKKGQQNMMLAIIGQCDKATKAQVKAHTNFATVMGDGTILNFIEIL